MVGLPAWQVKQMCFSLFIFPSTTINPGNNARNNNENKEGKFWMVVKRRQAYLESQYLRNNAVDSLNQQESHQDPVFPDLPPGNRMCSDKLILFLDWMGNPLPTLVSLIPLAGQKNQEPHHKKSPGKVLSPVSPHTPALLRYTEAEGRNWQEGHIYHKRLSLGSLVYPLGITNLILLIFLLLLGATSVNR